MPIKEQSFSNMGAFGYTNGITNGNFPNTTGWGAIGGTIAAANNTLSVTGNGTAVNPLANHNADITLVNGNKVYVAYMARVTNAVSTQMILQAYSSGSVFIATMVLLATPTQNQWYKISGIATIAAQVGQFQPRLSHWYADAGTANGKVLEVQKVFAVDLTVLFGVGNEPSSVDCDNIFKFVDGSLQSNFSKTLNT